MTTLLQIPDIRITNLRSLAEDAEDTLLGICTIVGVDHHVQFVRVERDEVGEQRPTRDPHGRYKDMQQLYDGIYHTVSLEEFGFEGD